MQKKIVASPILATTQFKFLRSDSGKLRIAIRYFILITAFMANLQNYF